MVLNNKLGEEMVMKGEWEKNEIGWTLIWKAVHSQGGLVWRLLKIMAAGSFVFYGLRVLKLIFYSALQNRILGPVRTDLIHKKTGVTDLKHFLVQIRKSCQCQIMYEIHMKRSSSYLNLKFWMTGNLGAWRCVPTITVTYITGILHPPRASGYHLDDI